MDVLGGTLELTADEMLLSSRVSETKDGETNEEDARGKEKGEVR